MNRVYKVIWSKAKHCYVVTSEIAKGYGKSAGSKGVKALLSGLVALSIAMGGYGLAGAVFVESKAEKDSVHATAVYTQEEVYTKSETDKELAKKADATALDGKADKATTLAGYGITNAYTKAAVNKKIAAEAAARKQADQNNLKIDEHGVVTMVKDDSNQDVNKLVLKVDGDNQITMDKDGIQVGKNNIVIGSDGTIKGANERFSVGTDGKVTAAYGKIGTVDITSAGAVSGVMDLTVKGDVDALGNLRVGNGNFTVKGITGNVTTGSAAIGGDLTVKGDTEMEGTLKAGATTVDSLDAGSGLIKTTGTVKAGKVKTGTLKTTGKATIGGDLTVKGDTKMKGDLSVKGEFKSETLSSELDKNNYTTINGGKTQSVNLKVDAVGTETQASASTFDENGSNAWAKDDDSIGKSSMTADKISQSLSDKGDNPPNAASRVLSQIADNKYEIADSVVDANGNTNTSTQLSDRTITNIKNGTNESIDLQEVDQIGSSVTDGTNTSVVNQNAGSLIFSITDKANNTSTGVTQTATDITNTAKNGTIANEAKDITNHATENMTNTVGGNLTTTVTGDSSLTAENITNEAKNRITNKAIDVETDATSSIVQKVTNDAGSNTSTQWSYQTLEEMSQADGKTASYLRGAVEEKSQLIDGSKKTTIDTVAGQTNTNITDGTNTSNDLQKADQIASSVTDGTNTTVVNQKAGSLASSITAGTKVNNTNNTVDKSEQLIKVDDTHFYAETKTAGKAEEALKSGNTLIDIVKDTNTATVSSAVFDGATITGISQNAKDISLSAAGGTIASGAKNITNTATVKLSNSAADIENTATTSITDKVGDNTSWKMTDGTVVESVKDASGKTNQTTTTAANTYQFVKDGDNTLAKRTSSTNDNLNITDGTNTYTKITTATSNKQTVAGGTETASTNLTKEASNTLIKNGTQSVLDHMAADTSYTVMNENGNGSRRQQTASEILDRVTDGTDTSEVKQTASEVATSAKDISNTATDKITNITGDNTVTSDTNGTTFANEKAKTPFEEGDERGTKDNTKITGNKVETGKVLTDFAEVANNLDVKGSTTLGRDGNTNLTVNSKSEFKDTVKMDSTLEVNGTSTLTGDVTMESNATVTKDLTVKGTSEFVHRADFRDNVFMDENLTVAKETRTDTLYVDHDGYVGGNLNVEGNIETHDAVLSADSRQVVTGRQLYQTNERVDRLDNRIKKVGANAAALAALRPGDFNPDDKFSIAAGFGSYRNANAAALGLFYRPNENVLLSLGTSFGDGENMVNAGVSVKFGRGKSMAERRKEMADEVSSMRDEMRSQDERIAELEEMLKKQSELIEKLSKES